MSWLQLTILLVFIGHSFGNSKPAVRVRVTQKGLNYGMFVINVFLVHYMDIRIQVALA